MRYDPVLERYVSEVHAILSSRSLIVKQWQEGYEQLNTLRVILHADAGAGAWGADLPICFSIQSATINALEKGIAASESMLPRPKHVEVIVENLQCGDYSTEGSMINTKPPSKHIL